MWEQVTQRYDAAQGSQASSFTETDTELFSDPTQTSQTSFSYIVKVARRLRDKPKNASNKLTATREEEMKNNPFLPPDPNLYVMQLTPTHSLVLNKFNIMPHHVIIITDEFEEQEVPLSVRDFEATWKVVQGMGGDGGRGGMAFFNRGPLSGASQPHKHIQCVPMPIARGADGAPLEAPFEGSIREALAGSRGESDALPFVHGVRCVVNATPDALCEAYGALLDVLEERLRGQWSREDSYNMLLTREYIMVIPRRAEYIESVSANAMGFAGSFFVGTQAEIHDLKRLGPSRVLEALGFSRRYLKS